MKEFIAVYMSPAGQMDEWMKLDEETRTKEEKKMNDDWKAWVLKHKIEFTDESVGVGKPKVVTAEGVKDGRNDIMFYSIFKAESAEAAAEMFTDNPHMQIPGSTIEIMATNKSMGI